MFRRTDSFVCLTNDGEQITVEEHTYFQGETPGMKQYRTKLGAAVTKISDTEFEIAGSQGPVKATREASEA